MNHSQYSATNHGNQTVSLMMGEWIGQLWICCEVISAALALLSLYIAVVLIIYARKQNVRRATTTSNSLSMPDSTHKSVTDISILQNIEMNHLNNTETPGVPCVEKTIVESPKSNGLGTVSTSNDMKKHKSTALPVPRSKERDSGRRLHRALMVCSIFVVLRCVVEQCLLLMGDLQDPACDCLAKVMVVSTALCLHCCHVFLWLRQLTFYSNPVLRPLRSTKLKVLSYSAYAIMPITLTASLVLFMVWRDYESVEGVCLPSKVNLSVYVPFGVLVASTVTIQIMLSSLFLYPLILHRRKRRIYDTNKSQHTKSAITTTTSSKGDKKCKRAKRDKLMDCIRRVFYGATVGITTDVIGGILSIFIPAYIPMFVYSVLYNLNVWLNVFCLLYTYADWRHMVFPWCFPSKTS